MQYKRVFGAVVVLPFEWLVVFGFIVVVPTLPLGVMVGVGVVVVVTGGCFPNIISTTADESAVSDFCQADIMLKFNTKCTSASMNTYSNGFTLVTSGSAPDLLIGNLNKQTALRTWLFQNFFLVSRVPNARFAKPPSKMRFARNTFKNLGRKLLNF